MQGLSTTKKRTMQITNVLMAFLLTALFTCNKEDYALKEGNNLTFTYAATQCADPWQNNASNEVTAQNVKSYLESQGVEVITVSVNRTSNDATCLACTCPSGKTIYVTVADSESIRIKLLQLGFQN
jgi:hypothetical protein